MCKQDPHHILIVCCVHRASPLSAKRHFARSMSDQMPNQHAGNHQQPLKLPQLVPPPPTVAINNWISSAAGAKLGNAASAAAPSAKASFLAKALRHQELRQRNGL